MDDGVDAVEPAPDRILVANVAGEELDAAREIRRRPVVDLRMQRVERANAVAARKQLVGEMRADEAGAAGYEDVLRQLPARRARRPRAARRPCRCAPR